MSDKSRDISASDAFSFTLRQRLAMLSGNCIPFLHICLMVYILCMPHFVLSLRIVLTWVVLYILPPFLARCLVLIFPIREERIDIPSRDYFVWWILLNLQMIFCRLPFFEELLRMIPGAYSLWLRLWGARIGSLTYWSPGLRVLDRGFLDIGDKVAFGAGVRLNPHVIVRDKDGRMQLLLADIHIGDGVIVGGYSLLTAGTHLEDDEISKAFLISPPFSRWKNGRRIRERDNDMQDAGEA